MDHNQLISTKGLRDVYTLLHLSCSHNHLVSVEGLENSALLGTLDLSANSLTEVQLSSDAASGCRRKRFFFEELVTPLVLFYCILQGPKSFVFKDFLWEICPSPRKKSFYLFHRPTILCRTDVQRY